MSLHSRALSPLPLLGAALAVAGVVLMFAPELVHDPGPASNSYEAIERRVWWGALAGLGVALVAHRPRRQGSVTLASALLWVVMGFLAARVVGLALDGADSGMQWAWVALEVVLLGVLGVFIRSRR